VGRLLIAKDYDMGNHRIFLDLVVRVYSHPQGTAGRDKNRYEKSFVERHSFL
jgi:hypothetical protein